MSSQEFQPLNLTLEDGRRALKAHVLAKGGALHEKYGAPIGYACLLEILEDREFVRHPTKIEFSSSDLEEGMFACAKPTKINGEDGYIINVHEYFQNHLEDVPALVFYHLVVVNYGEFASYEEAEEFGSSALGLKKDEYYQLLCRLMSLIEEN